MKTGNVALLQLCSGDNTKHNLAQIEQQIKQLPDTVQLVLTPENALLFADAATYRKKAETEGKGPLQDAIREMAIRYKVWILIGSMPLISREDPTRITSSSLLFDAEGNITTIFCTYDADTLSKDPADGRKVKGVIHWVSAAHALPVEIRLYDRLFSVPNPGAADDFLSVINPESLVIKQGFAEPSLKDAVAGKAFQFEREGYFCLDSRHSTAEKPVFNRTVGLRDTWAKVGE